MELKKRYAPLDVELYYSVPDASEWTLKCTSCDQAKV